MRRICFIPIIILFHNIAIKIYKLLDYHLMYLFPGLHMNMGLENNFYYFDLKSRYWRVSASHFEYIFLEQWIINQLTLIVRRYEYSILKNHRNLISHNFIEKSIIWKTVRHMNDQITNRQWVNLSWIVIWTPKMNSQFEYITTNYHIYLFF